MKRTGRQAIHRTLSRDAGFILPFAMAVVTAAALACATLLEVGIGALTVAALRAERAQAYWLARGQALALIRQMARGETPTPTSDVVYSIGKVHAVVGGGSPSVIRVTADTGQASVTVSATWDAAAKRVTAWSDADTN
ncbi:hypothetical protein [Alicyclobacillus sp.]|uniref:hypothetical protein n=1 Tax=Alicyclobacillus sp. TaxID=61169 RepID=UPI0025C6A4AE|nr:hypothetical protein [Alicyclobacillus sp.]MCL6516174.1 hypothetical protein [Alicyclobacillus sp.]